MAWHTLIIQHLLKLLYSTQTFPSGTPLRRETCKKVGSTSLSSLFLLYMYRVFSFFLLFHMFFFFSLSFFTFGKQCLHIPIISMWIFQSGTPLLSGRCMKVRPAFLSLFYMYCGCYNCFFNQSNIIESCVSLTHFYMYLCFYIRCFFFFTFTFGTITRHCTHVQCSIKLKHSTRTFQSGTLRRRRP